MSQAFRKLSCKLISFANRRQTALNLERRLNNSETTSNNSPEAILWNTHSVEPPASIPDEENKCFRRHAGGREKCSYGPLGDTRTWTRTGDSRAGRRRNYIFQDSPVWNSVGSNWERCFPVLALRHYPIRYGAGNSVINEVPFARYSTSLNNQPVGQNNSTSEESQGLPSKDQLQYVFDKLAQDLPRLYIQTIDYRVFSSDLALIDNIKGKSTRGIVHLVKKLTSMRIKGHLKYAYVKFDILKMTSHSEDGSIKVRWRVKGLTTLRVMLNCWKFKPWDMQTSLMEVQDLFKWEDGLYTFYVGDHGRIHTCVIDNVLPDNEEKIPKVETPLPAKMGAKLSTPVPPPTTPGNEK